jgi:hypothetical protein
MAIVPLPPCWRGPVPAVWVPSAIQPGGSWRGSIIAGASVPPCWRAPVPVEGLEGSPGAGCGGRPDGFAGVPSGAQQASASMATNPTIRALCLCRSRCNGRGAFHDRCSSSERCMFGPISSALGCGPERRRTSLLSHRKHGFAERYQNLPHPDTATSVISQAGPKIHAGGPGPGW